MIESYSCDLLSKWFFEILDKTSVENILIQDRL